jgi:uncharacterized repeat protein (TIGR01451 family)
MVVGLAQTGRFVLVRVRGALPVLVAAMAIAVLGLAPATAQAAFPGANGRIAFSADPDGDGNIDIYTVNPDGSDVRQLTTDSGLDFNPAWSPDGQKISFDRRACFNCAGGIWTMNADGSGQTQLAYSSSGYPYENPGWSPDGTQIAFTWSEHCNDGGLLVMNADGSNLHHVVCVTHPYNGPTTWSPDGTTIVWDAGGPTRYIYSVRPDGTNLTGLSGAFGFREGEEAEANFSPDGGKIVFTFFPYCSGCPAELNTMDSLGLTRSSIPGTQSGSSPAWSPDGTRIVLQKVGSGIHAVNVDGSGDTQISNYGQQPDWQPVAGADLAVTKTDSPDPVVIGTPLSYTILVTNSGPTAARDVALEDLLSKRLRLRALTSSQGHCRALHRLVRCELGDLGSGDSARVSISVRPIRSGPVTNTATVSAAEPPDPVPGNNSATATTTVHR